MEIIFSNAWNFVGTIVLIYCAADAIGGIVKVYKKGDK